MNNKHENKKPQSRILRFEDFQREHRGDKKPNPAQTIKPVDESEQSSYRPFSPEYYAGIEAGMNRIRNQFKPAAESQQLTIGEGTPSAGRAAPLPVDELTEHNYDGIQEYDNPTPGWWYAIFVACIIFGGFYIVVYHLAVPPLTVRHATAEARFLDKQFAELNKLETGVPKILTIMNEEAWLYRGAAIFKGSCAVCHSPDGSGVVGPNLTDETYNSISDLMGITTLIFNGTPNGSMPSQKNLLNKNEIALVTAYVASLRGKNLPTNPSVDPSYTGVPIPPWPTLDAAGNVVEPSAAIEPGTDEPARLARQSD